MKKATLLLAGGLIASGIAFNVAAADMPGGAMMKGEQHMMMGSHRMSGTVDKIDHAKGTLTLKSAVADMMLHFPPASIKDLKNGDTITVELGFTREDRGAMGRKY